MEEIRPLTLNEVLEFKRRGLDSPDLTTDEYSELVSQILDTTFGELPWRDLPPADAQLLCIAVFKETFKKFKLDMILQGVSFN
jgi:hypothetical protein